MVNCSNRHVFGADADTGELLWTRPLPTRFRVLACTPAAWRDCVFATGPDGEGGRLTRMAVGPDGAFAVHDVWTTPLGTGQHGALVVGDRLIAPYYRQPTRWATLDLVEGRPAFEMEGLTHGAAIWADGRLAVVTEDGEAVWMEAGDTGFRIHGRFRIAPEKARDCWAHPVLLDGRLYVRHHDRLACHDVRASTSAPTGSRPSGGGEGG